MCGKAAREQDRYHGFIIIQPTANDGMFTRSKKKCFAGTTIAFKVKSTKQKDCVIATAYKFNHLDPARSSA